MRDDDVDDDEDEVDRCSSSSCSTSVRRPMMSRFDGERRGGKLEILCEDLRHDHSVESIP